MTDNLDRSIDEAERLFVESGQARVRAEAMDLLTQDESNRFFSRIGAAYPDKCWEWIGSRFPKGYGSFCFRAKRVRATHIALLIVGNPRPDTQSFALHSCDNPSCVNPSHLRWGTTKENAADRDTRGRANSASGMRHRTKTKPELILRGEQHGCAKLTSENVLAIRRDCRMQREIARDYGVSRQLVGMIRSGKIWNHV